MPRKSKTDEIIERLEERLANIESDLALLRSATLMTDEELEANGYKRRGTMSQRERLRKARVARAASRHGMTFEEWTEVHGMRETDVPRGHDCHKPVPKTRKKRGAA